MASNSSMSADRRLTSLLVVMCTALALVIGATSSLSIALPDLARDLNASQAELTWIVNAYSVVFAAVLLPFGIAADRFGRRLALLLGLTIFGLASCVSAFLDDPTLVAVLRALAGLGAAGVFPATLSVLVDAFPPERRARAVAVWAGVSGGAATIGTFIGGGMLELSGWAGIQIVFGVLALALLVPVARFVDDHRNPRLSLDPIGGMLAVIGLGALVFGVIQAGDRSFGNPTALLGLGVGVAGLLAFVVWELRTDTPMLEVRLFRNPGLCAGSLVISLQFFAAFGFFFLAPQYLQIVQGYSAIETALAFLPLTVGVGLVTPLVPRAMASLGARWVGAVGMALVATAFLGLAAVTPDGGFWALAGALVVLGAGFGLSLTPATTLIVTGLPADRRTVSSAVNDLTREVGGALGGALLGTILIAVYQSQLADAVRDVPARAERGIAEAFAVAQELGPGGAALLEAAQAAYVDGFRAALVVAGIVSAAAAVICAVLAPAGATEISDPVPVAAEAA